MANAERKQQLVDTLQSQLACSKTLLQCLDSERDGLTARNLEQIEQSTRDKLELTRSLEQLDARRTGLLEKMGYANDARGMHQCMQDLPETKPLWLHILDNLSACRNGNLTNGAILESGRQQAEQALTILRGQHNSPKLYNPEGNTAPNFGNRELGKA